MGSKAKHRNRKKRQLQQKAKPQTPALTVYEPAQQPRKGSAYGVMRAAAVVATAAVIKYGWDTWYQPVSKTTLAAYEMQQVANIFASRVAEASALPWEVDTTCPQYDTHIPFASYIEFAGSDRVGVELIAETAAFVCYDEQFVESIVRGCEFVCDLNILFKPRSCAQPTEKVPAGYNKNTSKLLSACHSTRAAYATLVLAHLCQAHDVHIGGYEVLKMMIPVEPTIDFWYQDNHERVIAEQPAEPQPTILTISRQVSQLSQVRFTGPKKITDVDPEQQEHHANGVSAAPATLRQ